MTDTKKYFDACVASIAEIVKFDSSLAPAQPSMPFGKGAADCLAYFLDLAASFGFETHNYDNYVGEVIFGEGKEFAVLAHLDVVPAGKGWTKLPFGGEICDGKLYGRGTMDDKGPAVICLYCLRALKESGFVPKKKIKLIVGCNEECGWACIDHYNQCAHMPEEGFTPDADFPAIFAEKGILHFETAFPLPDAPFTSLTAGERPNMVCDYAAASGVSVRGAEKEGICVHGNTVEARGKSAHASTPEKGVNALGIAQISVVRNASRHSYDYGSGLFRSFGHSSGGLSHCRLAVDPALSGDYKVRSFHGLIHTNGVKDDLHSGLKLSAQIGHKSVAQSSGGSASRRFGAVNAQLFLCYLRKAP